MVIDGEGKIFEDRRGKKKPSIEERPSLKNKNTIEKNRRKEDKKK